MARILKWLLIVLVALIGLIVLAVAAVIAFVDPNDYRDEISSVVAEHTGHELVIEGDIQLSFFPWLGLDLGRTRVENPEGFGDEPLAQMDRAGVAVRVLPLFRGELVLDTIRLQGLRANLVVNEAGEANWELDVPDDASAEPGGPAPEEQPPAGERGDGGMPIAIGTIRGVQVSDLHVSYNNRRTGASHSAGPVNLELGELLLDEDVPLSADWVLSTGDGTRLEGTLEAMVRAGGDLQRFRAQVTELRLNAFADGLPEDGLEMQLGALLEMDLQQDTARLSDFAARVAGMQLNASADVRGLTTAPQVEGSFAVPEANLRDVLDRAGQEIPETADPDVLERFSLDGRFTANEGSAEITELAVVLDDTELDGTASVHDFADPAIRFDVTGNRFNADRYLPPGSDEAGAGAEAVGESEAADEDAEAAEIPLEPLRALNLDGRIRLGQLTVGGFELSEIDITVEAADGRIRIHPLAASLYGGAYRGDIRLDATGDALNVRADERLTGVQARPLVTQFLGRDLLRGVGELHLQAETAGREPAALLRQLVGEAELAFADGALVGLNLAQMVRNATARLQGEATAAVEERTTDFTSLRGSLRFDRGRIRSDDLQMQSPLFRVEGAGEANIFEQTVDYNLTVNLVGSLEGQGGSELDRLRRVPIPLRFQGALLSPEISLDLEEAITRQQRQRLREEEEQARQRLEEEADEREEEVRERARDQLRRLLD